jgi:hypothetical protein
MKELFKLLRSFVEYVVWRFLFGFTVKLSTWHSVWHTSMSRHLNAGHYYDDVKRQQICSVIIGQVEVRGSDSSNWKLAIAYTGEILTLTQFNIFCLFPHI